MEKKVIKRICFWCGIAVCLTLIISIIVRIVFFPVPSEKDIEEEVERYVCSKGDYLVNSVYVSKTIMRSDVEDCWYTVVLATENKNEDHQIEFQINYHPITGRIVSEYMYDL